MHANDLLAIWAPFAGSKRIPLANQIWTDGAGKVHDKLIKLTTSTEASPKGISEDTMPNGGDGKSEEQEASRSSRAELKLEFREYADEHFRRLDSDLQGRFDQRTKAHMEDLRSTVRRYATVAVIGLTLVGASGIYAAYKESVNQVKDLISSRVDREFETPRIQQIVGETAKDYTQKEAQNYISSQVELAISPFRNEMENTISRANVEVQNLSELFHVYALGDSAENGSRKAYDELRYIAAGGARRAAIARERLVKVERDLRIYQDMPTETSEQLIATTPSGKVSYRNFDLDELIRRMEDPFLPAHYRRLCMPGIKFKPKKQILEKALEVLLKSHSLPTCAAFCGVLRALLDEGVFGERPEGQPAFLDFQSWRALCEAELREAEH